MSAPWLIEVWDKAFTRIEVLADPQSVSLTPRAGGQPSGQVTVRNDHPLIDRLNTTGTRLTFTTPDGTQVMSGRLNTRSGDGRPDGQATFQVRDDWAVLSDILGWPVPGAATTTGTIFTQAARYHRVTGPAETVVKTVAQANITRLGLPITVAPDLGRGDTITVTLRMHPTADRLLPAVTNAGVHVHVRQVAGGLQLDVSEPRDFPYVVSAQSGIVLDWQWTLQEPEATRVVVGGRGEEAAREFLRLVNATQEAEWGLVKEALVDARDVDDSLTLAGRQAEMVARGEQYLTEHRAKAGLSLTLAETPEFRYGANLAVGDRVQAQLMPGAPARWERITEAHLNWNVESGYTASPVAGEVSDSAYRKFVRAVSRIAASTRNEKASR